MADTPITAPNITTLMEQFRGQVEALGYTIMSANMNLRPTARMTESERVGVKANPDRINVNLSL